MARRLLQPAGTEHKNLLFEFGVSAYARFKKTEEILKINGGLRDGETVYTNTDWSHPSMVSFHPPLVLHPGEGLTSEITYRNTRSAPVRFGLTSQDEMGIIFGYYYED